MREGFDMAKGWHGDRAGHRAAALKRGRRKGTKLFMTSQGYVSGNPPSRIARKAYYASKKKSGINTSKLSAAINRIESRIRKSDPRSISTRKLIHKSARLESILTGGKHGGAKYARQRTTMNRDILGAVASLAKMRR
jgi:hypothetical protein